MFLCNVTLNNRLIFAGIIVLAVVAVLSLAYVALNPKPVYLTSTANMVETSFVTEMPSSSATLIQTSQTQFTTVEESSAVTQTSCTRSWGQPPCGSVAINGEGSITVIKDGTIAGTAFLYYDGNRVGVIDPMSPAAGVNLSAFTGVVCFSGFVEAFGNTYVSQGTWYTGGTYSYTTTVPLIWLTSIMSGNCYAP